MNLYIILIISITIFGLILYYNLKNQNKTKFLENMNNFNLKEKTQNNNVIVSITTIPSRISKCEEIINSFFIDGIVSKVYVNVPKKYTRFPNENIVIPKFMINNPNIIVNRKPNDYGPGTKLFGTLFLNDVKQDTIIIVTDDDTKKKPGWSKTLVESVLNNPNAVTTMHPSVIHGGRGFAFKKSIFNQSDMLNTFNQTPNCLFVDDDFFTNYCNKREIPIIYLNDSKKYYIAETNLFNNKLRDEGNRYESTNKCNNDFKKING